MNNKTAFIVWLIYHICLMALVFAVAWITGSAWALLGLFFTANIKSSDKSERGKIGGSGDER